MLDRLVGRWNRARTVAIGWAVLLALVPALAGESRDQAVADSSPERLWVAAVEQVTQGGFEQAAATLDRLIETSPASESAVTMRGWLKAFDELEARRQAIRQQECEKHSKIAADLVTLVHLRPCWTFVLDRPVEMILKLREHSFFDDPTVNRVLWPVSQLAAARWNIFHRFHARMSHLDWTDVLGEARYAFLNAGNQEAFRREPWLDMLVSESIAAAEGYRAANEWFKASNIYYELTQIFPDDRGFKDALEECNGHARIDALYKPGGSWKQDIDTIHRGMLRSILHRINQDYVKKPDFRELTRSGLRALLLLVESDTLRESYASLKDEWLVSTFRNRIRTLAANVDRQDPFTYEDCRHIFLTALEANRQSIALDEGLVVAELVDGALKTLDEFSSVVWPDDVDEFRKHTVGEFHGVGISINMGPGNKITVFSPLEGTPAYEAGIQPGDIITKVQGEPTDGFTLNQAVEKITGRKGTEVVLSVMRRGEPKELEFRLIRDKITIHTVKGFQRDASGQWDYLLDPQAGIAYIRVSNFMENTVQELREALSELKGRGARGIILDLRFNPGGLLKSAVEMSDLLLPAGKVVVSTRGRTGGDLNAVRSQASADKHTDLPLIVLVNDYSASASEIVAGAVKDHHRGRVVGERTFGKGSVQNLIPIGDQFGEPQAYLKLTTQYYYLPSGRCLHRDEESQNWGVDADIPVKMYPKEIAYLLDMRREAEILRGKNQTEADPVASNARPHAGTDHAEDVAFDIQLEAARLVMKVRLLSRQEWPLEEAGAVAGDVPGNRAKSNLSVETP